MRRTRAVWHAWGAALGLEPDDPVSENLRDFRDLQTARTALIKAWGRLRNRRLILTGTLLKRQTDARLTLTERQLGEIDAEIARRIGEETMSARKRDIPRSIPGIGQIAAAAILTFRSELGALERKQAGSLAGLTPHNSETGQWKGKSFVSGGRKPLRDALYMPVLAAMRFNPDLKAKYPQLHEPESPPKGATYRSIRSITAAPDREQPVVPLPPGVAARRTPACIRHGTTSPFAAPDIATGAVICKCDERDPVTGLPDFLRNFSCLTRSCVRPVREMIR